jgi:hypothetical protein
MYKVRYTPNVPPTVLAMATNDFAYVVDGDPKLLQKRRLGGGGFGDVHEACSFVKEY